MEEKRFGRWLVSILIALAMVDVAVAAWAGESDAGETVSPFIRDLDQDGDGLVSAEEFPGPMDRFDDMDADADGVLTAEEFAAGRPPAPPMGNKFEEDDTDGDGLVSLTEFSGPEEHFEQMDADGDGYISRTEARPAHPITKIHTN